MKRYIEEKSMNFTRIDELHLLGQGGESVIYRVIPYLPLEIVAKIPLS